MDMYVRMYDELKRNEGDNPTMGIGTGVSGGAEFDTIVMTEAGGDTVTYTFSNQKYPKELSADEKAVFAAK